MVFSTSARNIELSQDEDGYTLLQAELKTNSGDWNPDSHCIDIELAVSPESPGFKAINGPPGNMALASFFEPSSLKLKGGSVLCGKVRGEWGGWEVSICLDVVYTNNDGKLERILGEDYQCLAKTMTRLDVSPEGMIRGFSLGWDGKLYFAELPFNGGKPIEAQNIRIDDDWHVKGELTANGLPFDLDLCTDFYNYDGAINRQWSVPLDGPGLQEAFDGLLRCLPSLALTIAEMDDPAVIGDATKQVTAQCICTTAIIAGYLVGGLFYGNVGAQFGPSFTSIAGSAVKSASSNYLGDRKMRDEVAAIAIYQVLQNELAPIVGIGLTEMRPANTDLLTKVPMMTNLESLIQYTRREFSDGQLDHAIADEMVTGWKQIVNILIKALQEGSSEDDIKHMFNDTTHDGVNLLNPLQGNNYVAQWREDIRAIQDQLYLVEPLVSSAVEESTEQALESIADGLAGLNTLLEFWPDYKGDEPTNEQRKGIIQCAAELIANGKQEVTDTDGDTPVLDKVLALEEKLNGLKTKFREETTAEQAEVDKIKAELPTAVEKMFANQKLYQSAQNELLAKVKGISDAELKHDPDATIEGGVKWYKDLLRRRTSALEETQRVADAAAAAYLQTEEIVVNLQARQAKLGDIHKRRFSVEREITKAEMIIDDLKIMINGIKQQEGRIVSVADILLSTLDDLTHVGEPPYRRQDRKIEDKLCTTILKIHRESLVDPSFVNSAREAVTAIQSWFDDYMPKSVQEEIDAIVNNPLYQSSTNDDA